MLSDAYNLKGCCFSNIGESNFIPGEDSDGTIKKYDLKKIFINDEVKYNTKGVFQMPDIPLLNNSDIYPIGLEMEVPHSVSKELRKLHIKGMFFVRQNRIPIALAQGVSIGISKCAHIPVLSQSTEDGRTSFIAESILSESGNSYILTRNIKQSIIKLRDSESSEGEDSEEKKEKDVMWESDVNGLLSQDVNLNKSLQSMLDGSRFVLKPYAKYDLVHTDGNFRYYVTSFGENLLKSSEPILAKLAYIGPNTPSRVLEESYFSSKSGSESELSTLRNLRWSETKTLEDSKRPIDEYTIRGNYTGYIGVIDGTLEPNTAYTIYNECYIGNNNSRRKIQVELRAQDQSPFLAISQRFGIDTENSVLKTVYRGDCFTCTTSIKMCHNFLDYNTPLNDKIIKANIETENDKKIRDDKNNPKNPFDYNN